ncbi:hypothetical protein EAO69_05475 [Streptomyces sp. me109]|nr:hypothetical protein EAO69_05475 [Streptomyces sp. me109]
MTTAAPLRARRGPCPRLRLRLRLRDRNSGARGRNTPCPPARPGSAPRRATGTPDLITSSC